MAAATQITVCRVLLEQNDMPTDPPFTINVLLEGATGRKRSRPGIAKVKVMLDADRKPNPTIRGEGQNREPLGICVYDRRAKSCADVTMLVKGVAEIECTADAFTSLVDGEYAQELRTVEKKANGVNLYRAFFDFSKTYDYIGEMTVTPGGGIEASENHLVRTLNFHDTDKSDLKYLQVGMPTNKEEEPGIMLWPLTEKSIGKGPSNPYAKAAVLAKGVVTLYIENADKITPLKRYTLQSGNVGFQVAALEVYQSSVRVEIIGDEIGEEGGDY